MRQFYFQLIGGHQNLEVITTYRFYITLLLQRCMLYIRLLFNKDKKQIRIIET